jgi:3-oxoacyl-[acyl-carrier-protein] synthase-1
MNSEVHIVAVGARTPVGLTAEGSAAAVRAGISRLGLHPELIDGAGKPLRCARDGALDPGLLGVKRLVELANSVLDEVAKKAFAQGGPFGAVRLFLALPDARPGFAAPQAEEVATSLRSKPLAGVTRVDVELVPGGHAGALRALEIAVARIAQRQDEICMVAGVDGYLDADTLEWLERDHRVDREGVRGGFSPGEAAGMLVLMSRTARARLRLPSLGRVRVAITGREPRSLDSDTGLLGEGMIDLVGRAAAGLHLPDERIDDLYCDINGERHRTDEWGFTVLRHHAALRDVSTYVTGAGAWGDVGAASGVLSCVLAVRAWERKYASGPRAMIWASSPSGLRGVAVLERDGAGT